jgi:RNA polymerase sigma factor (sigma-70 family)
MPNAPLDSVALRGLIARTRLGDRAAEDQLVRAVMGRFEGLARRMLHRFPNLRAHEETCDVVQDALLRLLGALKVVTPETTRDFFNLAAEQIRRQLLDLAKHHRRRPRAAHPAAGDDVASAFDPPDPAPSDAELGRWDGFHAAVADLGVDEREVFMLAYYHGWTQVDIADLFGVNEKTVRRRWADACRGLNSALGGAFPDG